MSRRFPLFPIGFTVVSTMMLVLMLMHTTDNVPGAGAVIVCNPVPPAYPDLSQADCLATQAVEKTASQQAAYPVASNTSTPQPTDPPPVQQVQDSPTPTATLTSTATRTATRTAAPTSAASPTTAPTQTATATATALPGTLELQCVPGATIAFTGETVPNQALLVYFDERPVGGGFSNDAGDYALKLRIGDERGGRYPVEVQTRDTRRVLEEAICVVPERAPTPTAPTRP
jgi:hypothetical protein